MRPGARGGYGPAHPPGRLRGGWRRHRLRRVAGPRCRGSASRRQPWHVAATPAMVPDDRTAPARRAAAVSAALAPDRRRARHQARCPGATWEVRRGRARVLNIEGQGAPCPDPGEFRGPRLEDPDVAIRQPGAGQVDFAPVSHRDFKQLLARAAADHDSLVFMSASIPSLPRSSRRTCAAWRIRSSSSTRRSSTRPPTRVCCYKPQFAHYAALGAEDQLLQTIRYINARAPGVPVILESAATSATPPGTRRKRSSSYGADAVTVNPYLGGDSLQPFLDWKGQGHRDPAAPRTPARASRTSRSAAGASSITRSPSAPRREWNHGNCLLVVGATYPAGARRGARDRRRHPVPRCRASALQGGDVVQVGATAARDDGGGLIINSSRGIPTLGRTSVSADAARAAAQQLRRDQTPQAALERRRCRAARPRIPQAYPARATTPRYSHHAPDALRGRGTHETSTAARDHRRARHRLTVTSAPARCMCSRKR